MKGSLKNTEDKADSQKDFLQVAIFKKSSLGARCNNLARLLRVSFK